MRLIDADLLMQNLGFENTKEEREENVGEIITWEDVDRIPTAFDVDEVVERIESIKRNEDGACSEEECGYCKYFRECWDGEMRDFLALDKAIEIIKGGMIDEQNQ